MNTATETIAGKTVTVTVSKGRPSVCMEHEEGALDLDVQVTVDEVELTPGEKTMVRDRINGGMVVYGDCPDTWLTGALIDDLREIFGRENELRSVLELIAHQR